MKDHRRRRAGKGVAKLYFRLKPDFHQRVRTEPGMIFTVLWAVFFFHGMTPGFWLPALTNILGARGLADWVPATPPAWARGRAAAGPSG